MNKNENPEFSKYPKVFKPVSINDKSRLLKDFDHNIIVETRISDQLEGISCILVDGKIYTKDKVTNKVVELRESLESQVKNKKTI